MTEKKWIQQFSCWVFRLLLLIFGIVILYLTFMSLFSTALIEVYNYGDEVNTVWGEHTFFIKDNWLVHIAALLLFFIGAGIVRRTVGAGFTPKREKYVQYFLLAVFGLVGFAVFYMTMQQPKSDQGKVLRIAMQLVQGNYEQFGTGGYMHRYPDQTGIVLMLAAVAGVFGKNSYLVIQLLNLLMLMGTVWTLKAVAEYFFMEKCRHIGSCTLLFCLLFFPLYSYVTFIYGTVPGLFFSVLAMYLELLFLKSRRMTTGLAASVCIGVAVIFKTNSLIFAIAMAAFLLYDIIVAEKKYQTIVFTGLLCLCIGLLGGIVNKTTEGLTGIPVAKGMPKTAWIAMGLQESDMAPGWWNGYSVSLYEECGYDEELTDERAKENIKDNIRYFCHNKRDGLYRLGRKMASQWNNPTFQCFTVNEGRESEREMAPVMQAFVSGKWRNGMTGYMNLFQSILLFGVLLYFIYGWKRVKIYELLPAVAMVGGFIFHIFWEAKCQYVLPYFLILFPYAAFGYYQGSIWAEAYRKKVFSQSRKKLIREGVAVFIILVLMGICSRTTIFRLTVGICDTPEQLEKYEAILEER